MGRNKSARQKQQERQEKARAARTAADYRGRFGDDWDRMLTGEIGPMTFEGRVITAEVIAEMRVADPEHAHQLDADWERQALENNRPWIENPEFREVTERLWADARRASPESFANSGCDDC
ncbi:hypothetical protein ACIPWL_32620 [Streptomyces sp. NPDC090023]|uniref:hypothetical protein n=1 Tax=unclassified Streptomyces TaxID=2593676 RepID=UPI003803D09E